LRDFPLAKEGLPLVVPALVLALLFFFFALYAPSVIFFLLFLFFSYFFRNPKRTGQSAALELIAPADGKITGIDEVHLEEFLDRPALRISTFMGLGDVHVNRAPCDGLVSRIKHESGKFELAFRKDVEKINERNYILLEKGDEKLVVVQIAGFLARRICCWVHERDTLRKGDRIGIIAFGSRVDLYIPPGYESMVQLGQRVKAGLTPLARKVSIRS